MNLISRYFKSRYFKLIIAPVVISGGALFLFWSVLSGKFLTPTVLYHYAYFEAMGNFVYKLGILPNWLPSYNSGYPISLTLDAFLNPLFILILKFLPAFTANNLMIFFFFVINGLSLYALARALKLSKTASLISAISYAFSGVIIRYVDITGIVALMPFLPLSFLCCLKIFQGKKKWFFLWLPLLLYSWIGGWSEMIVYALFAVFFFSVYLFFKEKRSGNFSYFYPAIFFGAVILSVLILSPWLLSVMHFVSFSERAGGVNAIAAANMPTTFSHFLHMIHPRISIFYGENLPFFPLKNGDNFLFFGFLPILLVFASFFAKHKRGFQLYFSGLAIGLILTTIKHSPLFWLFHQIPVLKWFGGAWKWSFLIVFSLALLAGFGFDNIKDFFKNRFSKKIIIGLWTLMFLAILGTSVFAVFEQKIKSSITTYGTSHYKDTTGRVFARTNNYYDNLIEKISQSVVDNFSIKNNWMQLSLVLWLITLSYFTLGKYGPLPRQQWRIIAVPVTLLGSVLVWTGFLTGPPIDYIKKAPATAQFLHSTNSYTSDKLPINTKPTQNLEPYRIFQYIPYQFISILSEKYEIDLVKPETRQQFAREIMDYNIHLFYNFDTFQNHQTLALQRLADVNLLAHESKNLHLLGMLNIKYILTPFEFNNLNPVFTTHVADGKLPIYVYENPYFMPRWYFANEIKWAEPKDETALETLKTITDFREITMLETLDINDPATNYQSSPNDTMELELYTAGRLRLKTKTDNYRFVVFSESRIPFWQAFINDKEVPLYTANYLYQAVLVPPGENIIEFRYPKLWEQGVVSAQSLLNSSLEKLKPQLPK